MKRTNCLDRAGQILIMIIWIEKRLIDLIILKKHPLLIKKINFNKELPQTFIKERIKFWKKSYQVVLKDFLMNFSPQQGFKENLESLGYYRDMISHSHISLYKSYLLYKPDTERTGKSIKNIRKVLQPRKPPQDKPKKFILKLELSNDLVYKTIVCSIEEIDSVYLSGESKKLGIDYEKLR